MSPGFLSAGSGSPVSMDSLTPDDPFTTVPSTGMEAPGFTRSYVPVCASFRGISESLTRTMAVFGERFISFLIASPVLPFVPDSSIFPRRISVMIMAEVSK